MPDRTPLFLIPYPLPEDALTDYPALGSELANTIEGVFKAPSCRAYSDVGVSAPHNATTVVPLNRERWDTPHPSGGGMHDGTSAAPGRIYAPRAGIYAIHASMLVTAGGTPTNLNSYARLRHQNTNYIADVIVPWSAAAPAMTQARLTLSSVWALAFNEMVELCLFNSSGFAATINSSAVISPEFALTWLAPIPPGAAPLALDGRAWDEPREELPPLDYNGTILEPPEGIVLA